MDFTPRKKTGWNQGLFSQSSTQKERLGTVRELSDGRTFVYCKDGGSGLSPGTVCASAFTTGMNEQTVTVAHAIGTKTVTMTDSGAGTSADAYKDGKLVVTAGTGIGEIYSIKGNTAATAGATFQLKLETGLLTAWSTSDTDITVYANKYNGVDANPTDGQQLPVCVAQRTVTADYYFWGQVLGEGSMLIDCPAAGGLELDEKIINPSLNHAGYGYIDGSPDAAAVLAGFRHILGYYIPEADATDNEAALVQIRIGL